MTVLGLKLLVEKPVILRNSADGLIYQVKRTRCRHYRMRYLWRGQWSGWRRVRASVVGWLASKADPAFRHAFLAVAVGRSSKRVVTLIRHAGQYAVVFGDQKLDPDHGTPLSWGARALGLMFTVQHPIPEAA